MRVATVDVEAPCEWLNSNQRIHRMVEAKRARLWRAAAAAAAAGVAPVSGRVRVVAHIWKPRRGRYDPGNLYPTAKAIVDGLTDAGVWVDDDHEHVVGPDMRHGGHGQARVVLFIEEAL